MIVAAQHSSAGFRNPFARAGGAADRQRAMELLEFTGIAGHAGKLAGTLSYGQRKLLELSYVLVADPAIVLLDEPAGGVNPSLVNQLADRIRQLNAAGKTFLIVEHNMEFVMGLCHHIAVLDFGTIVATGQPSEVRNNPRVLDAYLGTAEDGDEPGAVASGMGETGNEQASGAAGARPAADGQAALVVDGLTAGYGGGDVLHAVSLTVAEGGITCVVGPNGCGKSTLLATISGLIKPRLGSISFRGQPLAGRSPRQVLSAGIVHVPQNHSLFREMTVAENIELGGYLLTDRSKVARRRAEVEEMFPAVAGWANQKAGSLSGGQQRLVEFARCLMLDPALVILDEPSVGLAPKVLKTVFDAVRLMNASGKTILLVEQNARAGLALSSHGIVMENGRIRLSGTGREVLEHPEIGALYLGGSASSAEAPQVSEVPKE